MWRVAHAPFAHKARMMESIACGFTYHPTKRTISRYLWTRTTRHGRKNCPSHFGGAQRQELSTIGLNQHDFTCSPGGQAPLIHALTSA